MLLVRLFNYLGPYAYIIVGKNPSQVGSEIHQLNLPVDLHTEHRQLSYK